MVDTPFSQWVEQALQAKALLGACWSLEPLAGDAGFRQYYRVVGANTPLLAVRAPKTAGVSESAQYFSQLSETLRTYQIPTPQIIACDVAHNYLLIESFGSVDLLEKLNVDTVEFHYKSALQVLMDIQHIPFEAAQLPAYDAGKLYDEMRLFPQWFVNQLLGVTLDKSENQRLEQVFDHLVSEASAQPQVFVHRDFHSRNLMYRDGLPPGVIDFQDALWGPVTYDLVSLLRDCYIHWPQERVTQWALEYRLGAIQTGILPEGVTSEQFLCWFDIMGLQRHLKVLGIFARLSLRDNKHRYLNDLPLVIRYVLEIGKKYTHTQPLAQWFERRLLPLIRQQPWYEAALLEDVL